MVDAVSARREAVAVAYFIVTVVLWLVDLGLEVSYY